eukprot:364323-Chlamydomonas_euryale.AAC.23
MLPNGRAAVPAAACRLDLLNRSRRKVVSTSRASWGGAGCRHCFQAGCWPDGRWPCRPIS